MTHEQLEALLLYYCDDLDHTKRPAIGEDDVTTTIRLVLADHARLTAALAELKEQLHYANGVADLAMKHRDAAEASEARMREALEEYACLGLARCSEPKLKDGSCIHAGIGRCGDVAFRALSEGERG